MAELLIPHSLPTLGDEEAEAAAEAIKSGWVKAGPRVAELEERLSADLGCHGAIACTSGTQALHLAFRTLDLGPGNEVAIPSYVCRQVYDAVRLSGATPLICDSSTEHFGLDPTDLSRRRRPALRAVVQVHLFGVQAPLDAPEFAGLLIIEDMCQRLTHPDIFPDKKPSPAIVRVLSFEATKPITCGEGGMLLSDNPNVLARARELRDASSFCRDLPCHVPMTDIQAAVALVQWRRYAEFLKRRLAIADVYRHTLPPGQSIGQWGFRSHPAMATPMTLPYRWVGWCERASDLVSAAQAAGIGIKRPVKPEALHTFLGKPDKEFRGAGRLMEGIVSLPLYPALDQAELHQVLEFMDVRGELHAY